MSFLCMGETFRFRKKEEPEQQVKEVFSWVVPLSAHTERCVERCSAGVCDGQAELTTLTTLTTWHLALKGVSQTEVEERGETKHFLSSLSPSLSSSCVLSFSRLKPSLSFLWFVCLGCLTVRGPTYMPYLSRPVTPLRASLSVPVSVSHTQTHTHTHTT